MAVVEWKRQLQELTKARTELREACPRYLTPPRREGDFLRIHLDRATFPEASKVRHDELFEGNFDDRVYTAAELKEVIQRAADGLARVNTKSSVMVVAAEGFYEAYAMLDTEGQRAKVVEHLKGLPSFPYNECSLDGADCVELKSIEAIIAQIEAGVDSPEEVEAQRQAEKGIVLKVKENQAALKQLEKTVNKDREAVEEHLFGAPIESLRFSPLPPTYFQDPGRRGAMCIFEYLFKQFPKYRRAFLYKCYSPWDLLKLPDHVWSGDLRDLLPRKLYSFLKPETLAELDRSVVEWVERQADNAAAPW